MRAGASVRHSHPAEDAKLVSRRSSSGSFRAVELSDCPRLVGPAKAKELIYTGRFVRADEALQIGLVDQWFLPPRCTRPRRPGRPGRARSRYALRAAKGRSIAVWRPTSTRAGDRAGSIVVGLLRDRGSNHRDAVVRRGRPGEKPALSDAEPSSFRLAAVMKIAVW